LSKFPRPALLAEAAFLDRDEQCLLFLDGGRIRVPVDYDQGDLEGLDLDALKALLGLFQSDLHRDERLSILARAAREMMAPHPAPARFRHLLAHFEDLEARVRDGYRLFAAAFSYDRIRSQMEKEAADTVARIHKTVTDIQGQMLGIPVATVIAATQMKAATECGAVALGNLAVLVGVVIFAVLLFVALRNQWLTLETIAKDVSRQTERMNKEHADIRRQFADLYEKVEDRLSWHR